jgi:hypothetical protein
VCPVFVACRQNLVATFNCSPQNKKIDPYSVKNGSAGEKLNEKNYQII